MIDLYNYSEVNITDFVNKTVDVDITKAVIVGAILSSVICVIIGGNVLILLAVYANSHLRSTTNYFIVNLACADLLLGITVLPFSATLEIIGYWPFGQVFCEIWAAIDVLWCTGSIITLTAISVDRYIGVTRPLQHSTIMSEKKACYIIIFAWIVSAAVSVVPFIGWKEPPSLDPTVCTVNSDLGYVLVSVSVSFYIPMSVIIFVYIRIYKEAVKHSACLQTGTKLSKLESEGVTLRVHTGRASSHNGIPCTYQSSSSSEHSDTSSRRVVAKFTIAGKLAKFKREKKAAQTLGIVVGVFLLCWFPFFFCLPLTAIMTTGTAFLINTIVYYWRHDQVQNSGKIWRSSSVPGQISICFIDVHGRNNGVIAPPAFRGCHDPSIENAPRNVGFGQSPDFTDVENSIFCIIVCIIILIEGVAIFAGLNTAMMVCSELLVCEPPSHYTCRR